MTEILCGILMRFFHCIFHKGINKYDFINTAKLYGFCYYIYMRTKRNVDRRFFASTRVHDLYHIFDNLKKNNSEAKMTDRRKGILK